MTKYKKSGVDIDKGNELVKKIKRFAPLIGGFSGLFPFDKKHYLASSCDGIGTKLKVAFLLNKHNTVGIDLVAMNVNDLVTCGAKPLFFLDYFATGKLEVSVAQEVIKGIKRGCDMAGCVLLGGETAEMPGFYKHREYDLAGFAVGVVEKNKVINGSKIKPGDLLIGLKSSGLHSNGFSLVRKIFSESEIKKLGEKLLTPTRIYVREIQSLVTRYSLLVTAVHGISHITGGGFYDNIVRTLPKNCKAVIYKNNWKVPEIFRIIQAKGKIKDREMFRVFNMGIGMVIVADTSALKGLQCRIKESIIIGEITKGKKEVLIV